MCGWKKFCLGLLITAGLVLYGSTYQTTIPPDNTISRAKLQKGCVDSSKLADQAVSTAKIDADAVTGPKLDAWVAAMSTEGRAPAGSLFTRWYNDGTDSGYYLVNVDELGDTLALLIYRTPAAAGEKLTTAGPYAYTASGVADSVQFWCNHDWYILPPRSILPRDFHVDGVARYLFDYDTTTVLQTSEMIVWNDSWEFQSWHAATTDTIHLLVKRTIATRRGEPYFLLRYMFASDDSLLEGDTLRVLWCDEPQMGDQTPYRSTAHGQFDLGYVPGYGEVRRRALFADTTLDMCAGGVVVGWADIGNAHANTGIDTINGASGYLSSTLKADCGSGTEEFIASFIAWNTSRGIVPTDIAYVDTLVNVNNFPNLAFDSTFALHAPFDTTEVMSNNDRRSVFFRTAAIEMSLGGNYQSMEIAIGRVRLINDRMPPIFPRVMFLDGTVLEPMNLPRKQ